MENETFTIFAVVTYFCKEIGRKVAIPVKFPSCDEIKHKFEPYDNAAIFKTWKHACEVAETWDKQFEINSRTA